MRKKKHDIWTTDNVVAPGMDDEDAYGEDASEEEIAEGESTTVTRLINDEYEPS